MLAAASQFLNELESCITSGQDVPIPHVMRRILHLLAAACPIELPTVTNTTSTQTAPIENTAAAADTYVQDSIREFRECLHALKSTTYPLFVDIQYVYSKRGSVIKEFSAECVGCPSAWITVKSPSDDSPRYEYTTTISGLYWDCGLIDLLQLKEYTAELFENGKRNVFVKGLRKVAILAQKLNLPKESISDLWFCPNLRLLRKRLEITDSCPYHRHLDQDLACAKKNTHAMVKSGITDVLLKQWSDSSLLRCEMCRKTADCVTPRSNFTGHFSDVCCKCKMAHYTGRRNNTYEECGHIQNERSEYDSKVRGEQQELYRRSKEANYYYDHQHDSKVRGEQQELYRRSKEANDHHQRSDAETCESDADSTFK